MIIDVKVSDLDRAVSFYQNILELPLIHKAEDWASFEAFGAEIHLYLHGGISFGLEFRVVNIKEKIRHLKAKGIKFFAESDQPNLIKIDSDEIMEFPWGKTTLFNDSEGNQLAIVEEI